MPSNLKNCQRPGPRLTLALALALAEQTFID